MKKAGRGLPNPLAGGTQRTKNAVKKATPKKTASLPNPFGGAKQAQKKVQKSANKVAKKAPAKAKQALGGGGRTKGWFGGAGGPQDLDRWYGEISLRLELAFPISCKLISEGGLLRTHIDLRTKG